jgi:hypothetical protein
MELNGPSDTGNAPPGDGPGARGASHTAELQPVFCDQLRAAELWTHTAACSLRMARRSNLLPASLLAPSQFLENATLWAASPASGLGPFRTAAVKLKSTRSPPPVAIQCCSSSCRRCCRWLGCHLQQTTWVPISCHDACPAGVPEQRDEGQPATAAAAPPAEPAAPGVAATAPLPLPVPTDAGPAGATAQAAPSLPAAAAPAPPAASGQPAADPAVPPAGGAAAQLPSPPAGAAAAASTPAASAPTSDGGAAGPGSSGKKGVQHKTPFQKEALEAAFSSAQRALGGAAWMPPWLAHLSRARLFFVLVRERESQRPACGRRGGWGWNTAQLSPSILPPLPPVQ